MGFVAKLVLSHSEKRRKCKVPVSCGCLDRCGKQLLYTGTALVNFVLLPAQPLCSVSILEMSFEGIGNSWTFWEAVTFWGAGTAAAAWGGLCHGDGRALLYGLKIQFLILSDRVSYVPV